nr:hypothetical protein [Mangrovicoccus ximenensis]
MPRASVSVISAGQNSLSVQTARSGCQCARKRRTKGTTSSGMNWCTVRGGIRAARSSAEVTVPVVTRKFSAGSCIPSRLITSRIDRLSPTEAAWNQISGPSGRGSEAWPSRSARRAGSSLPRASRFCSWRRPQPSALRENAR